jgi:hypothetical protein
MSNPINPQDNTGEEISLIGILRFLKAPKVKLEDGLKKMIA